VTQRLIFGLLSVPVTDATWVLLVADLDAEQLGTANTMARHPNAWHAVQAGGRLRLATSACYPAAVQAVQHEQVSA
jgi:hypothetical protein